MVKLQEIKDRTDKKKTTKEMDQMAELEGRIDALIDGAAEKGENLTQVLLGGYSAAVAEAMSKKYIEAGFNVEYRAYGNNMSISW